MKPKNEFKFSVDRLEGPERGHKENTLSERILNGRMLSTLGNEYDHFKDLWDTIPEASQRLNLLVAKLSTIEAREPTEYQQRLGQRFRAGCASNLDTGRSNVRNGQRKEKRGSFALCLCPRSIHMCHQL